MIKVKRIYDKKAKTDGQRVLIDRLWPRGVKKEDADIDAWRKDLAPSKELFTWFHADREKRFKEFGRKYMKELKDAHAALEQPKKSGTVTLVTAVKDIEHSHVPVLKKFLERK